MLNLKYYKLSISNNINRNNSGFRILHFPQCSLFIMHSKYSNEPCWMGKDKTWAENAVKVNQPHGKRSIKISHWIENSFNPEVLIRFNTARINRNVRYLGQTIIFLEQLTPWKIFQNAREKINIYCRYCIHRNDEIIIGLVPRRLQSPIFFPQPSFIHQNQIIEARA